MSNQKKLVLKKDTVKNINIKVGVKTGAPLANTETCYCDAIATEGCAAPRSTSAGYSYGMSTIK